MAMKILNIDQPQLTTKAEEVKQQDLPKIVKLAKSMLKAMYEAQGIGLAANQVGHLQQVFVMDVSLTQDKPWIVINPKITKRTANYKDYLEGCLSIPGVMRQISRPARITVKYLDHYWEKQTISLSGLLAVCFQHELDHLNGVLFLDYLAKNEREEALAEYRQMLDLLSDQKHKS